MLEAMSRAGDSLYNYNLLNQSHLQSRLYMGLFTPRLLGLNDGKGFQRATEQPTQSLRGDCSSVTKEAISQYKACKAAWAKS